jgi:quercetin dioxygenase-like cupin family protein
VPGARCFAVALEQAELTYYEIRPGTRFPRHAHDVEQITLVLDGELRFEVDDRPPIRLGAGEAVALPSGVPHAVVAGAAPVRAVDAWSKSPVSSRIGTSRAGTRGNIENLAGSMVGLASRQALERWFERTFPESLPVARAPAILERLRGTPARVEETVLGASRAALTRRSGTSWTAQEHVGHLGDLEALFCARLDDFDAGAAALRPTDLDNRATTEAGHDRRDLAELLRRFRAARARLVARLSSWDPARLARTALHPRLQRPFSVVDHAHFVAEHDDHHLAAIRALLADPAGGP